MNIESKHLFWIFDAAGEFFVKKIVELENEIVRHEKFKNCPFPSILLNKSVNRRERICVCKQSINEYRICLDFCLKCKKRSMLVSAEECAADFKEFIEGQK